MANIGKGAFLILLFAFCMINALDQGETYFSFNIRFRSELDSLTRNISIDNVKGTTVFAYATDKQLEKFKSLGYSYTVLPHPGTLYSPYMNLKSTKSKALLLNAYPTYSQYVSMMQQFASTYPSICVVENIGSSVNGRSLLIAKISSNVTVETQKPSVFLTSSMHGDETAGYSTLLKLIDYLLTNATTVPRVTAILNNVVIYTNPLANPDGTYFGGDNTVLGARRFNANGVDLNRNMPLFTSGLSGDGNPFQPETRAMIEFADNHSIALSINFHGGAEVVNFPWDTDIRRHADDAWFFTTSLAYAQEVQQNGPPGYFTDVSPDGVTNGYDWYQTFGSRQDYMTFWKRGREVTIELSETKLIPEASFDAYYNYNRDAILGYIDEARFGIRGIITDAATGQPLAASVEIGNHDVDRSGVWTNPQMGDYHRFLSPGTYTVTVRAVGYTPRTLTNITVLSRQATTLDVALSVETNQEIMFKNMGVTLLGMDRNSGDFQTHGISQTSPYDRGLRFFPTTGSGTTFDNDGNSTCAAITANQGLFLNTSSNLSGGLVFRDDMGLAVAHVSTNGVIRVRGSYIPGFSVQ